MASPQDHGRKLLETPVSDCAPGRWERGRTLTAVVGFKPENKSCLSTPTPTPAPSPQRLGSRLQSRTNGRSQLRTPFHLAGVFLKTALEMFPCHPQGISRRQAPRSPPILAAKRWKQSHREVKGFRCQDLRHWVVLKQHLLFLMGRNEPIPQSQGV